MTKTDLGSTLVKTPTVIHARIAHKNDSLCGAYKGVPNTWSYGHWWVYCENVYLRHITCPECKKKMIELLA